MSFIKYFVDFANNILLNWEYFIYGSLIPDDAVELPKTLNRLDCKYNNLTKLPELPDNLTYLDCWYNKLTELPDLPSELVILYCSYNKITELTVLPKTLDRLDCFCNLLTELPELPDMLTYLYFGMNNIKYLSPHNCMIIKHNIKYNKFCIMYNPVSDSFNSNGQFQDSL